MRVKDALADGKEISIRAFQLPIINRELLEAELEIKTDLIELFESTRQALTNKIEKILMQTTKRSPIIIGTGSVVCTTKHERLG